MNLFASCSSSSNRSRESGFSLLELAIVLAILGAIGGIGIPLLTAHMTRAALLKTRANQGYVLNAVAVYVFRNNRLPCPAEPHILGDNFGVALDSCRMEKAKGIIPFKTLGISEHYGKDGFKRLMTYVIEPELAKHEMQKLSEVEGGLITIKNETGSSSISSPNKKEKNKNYTAIVILSHGESGVGAYIGNGQTGKIIGHSLSPHKQENCDDNFVFIESSQSDDILHWESRDQFLKHYVGFMK